MKICGSTMPVSRKCIKRVTMRLNSGENDDDRHASIASVFYYTAKIRFIKDKPY